MKPNFNGSDEDGKSWILRFWTILGIVKKEREREREDVWESRAADQVGDGFTIFFESLASPLLHGFSWVLDFVYNMGTGLESS